MLVKEFFWFIGLIFISQLIIWFQINAQFVWPKYFTKYELIAILIGAPISWLLIKGTKYGVLAFDGLLWPQRLICFATGIILFSIFTWVFLNEGITTKTSICLILSVVIVLIQVFWK